MGEYICAASRQLSRMLSFAAILVFILHQGSGFSVHNSLKMRYMTKIMQLNMKLYPDGDDVDTGGGMEPISDRERERRSISSVKATAMLTMGAVVTGMTQGPLPVFADEASSSSSSAWSDSIDLTVAEPRVTDVAWMDIQIGSSAPQRIEISLYGDVVPKTTENFKRLCSSHAYGEGYKGSSLFRVISDFSVQGGNIGNTLESLQTPSKLGSFGRAADGLAFPPENFRLKHSYSQGSTQGGVVSMMKDLRNKSLQDSRFFITLKADGGWADDKYSAFGRISKGMDLISGMAILEVVPPSNYPKTPITIVDCGVY